MSNKVFTNVEDVITNGLQDKVVYARKTVLTRVILMDESFTCVTPEGTNYEGKPGDYLAIGVKGEVYPIGADFFARSYEIVELVEKNRG